MHFVAEPLTSTSRYTTSVPRVCFEVHGSGPTIVFVHGIGGNRENWIDQVADFSPHYQVVTLDLRGYGDSEWLDGALHLDDFAQDVAAVLDEIGVQRAHLVGLSMGGLVIQAFYAKWPERVLSLVLAACRGGHAPVAQGAEFARRRLEPLNQSGSTTALADSLLPTLLGPKVTPLMVQRLRASLIRLKTDNYIKVIEMRVTLTPFLDLSQVGVPALVLGGRQDQLAPVPQMEEISSLLPNSQCRIFEDCGHFLNIEQCQAFNSSLQEFYKN